jgi:hypothetical protein
MRVLIVLLFIFFFMPSFTINGYKVMYDFVEEDDASSTLNIFYCSKRQKDKTQVKQLRQSSPNTYISKYTIEHNNI